VIAPKQPGKADLAMVISDLSSGGAQRVLVTLANHWASKGLQVAVLTYDGVERDFFPLADSIHHIAIRKREPRLRVGGKLLSNLARAADFRRVFKSLRPGVVVSFIAKTNILVILSTFGLGLRVVISERNDPAKQSFGRLWDFMRKRSYRYADVVTANSMGALETMKAFVPERKLAWVPNPVNLPLAGPKRVKDSQTILAVGRLTKQKGHDVLLAAFASIAHRYPAWRLEIVGEGDLGNNLRDESERLGLKGKLKWLGQVKDISSYYARSDIFVLPSRYEGCPNALLEAMSHELPVIVTDASTGPLEIVENEVCGLVVPSENPEALANAMERMINDKELRERLGRAGMDRVENSGVEEVAGVWEGLLGFQELERQGMKIANTSPILPGGDFHPSATSRDL
jgi:GalNAc-alpha-(1->4)-GalNAc-alpha-(1->3)-diNAcBac-PP-undecaprenol alpha-1,4-N-acetyl-D-galactosaminyltransferase